MEPVIAASSSVVQNNNAWMDNALTYNQLILLIHAGLLNVVMELSVKMENVLLKQ